MNTQENNKLIAEFMELPKVSCNIGTEDGHFTEGYKHPKIDVPIIPNGMQYKYSWDWLMPVVENCLERLDARDRSADEIKRQLLVCNLRGVHTAVVEFINQYNETKWEYKTCDRCSYDILDDEGDVLEHHCIDDELYRPIQ